MVYIGGLLQMKRIISVVLILVMLFCMTISFGAKREEPKVEITDGRSGVKYQLNSANLLFGGKDIISDVPSVIFENRTLVPVSFIVKRLGAKTSWNRDTDEATITTPDKTIVLKINSSTATVNGKKVTLPDGVPAKLMGYQENYRTMVPLRFVSKELGMDVNWDKDTRTAIVDYPKQDIVGVEYKKNGLIPQLSIKASGMVEFTTLYLPGSQYGGSDRLVVDIPNTYFNINDNNVEVKDGFFKEYIGENGITAMRGSIFEVEPRSVTRIVVDLEKTKGYNAYFDKETNEIKVDFLNNVKNVEVDKKLNTEMVVISTDEPPVYNIMDLGNRVVVDVLNAQTEFSKPEIPVSRGGISRIRTAPFKPDINYNENDKIVRIVLDLEEGQTAENLYIESAENDIYIYMNDKPLKGFDYFSKSYNESLLELALQEEGEYSIDFNDNTRELILKLDKDSMELIDTELEIDDEVVEAIDIDGNRSSKYNYITLKLAKGTKYENLTDGQSELISVLFTNSAIEQSKYEGQVIVLDAGHGGHDSGAIGSVLKVKEKNVALDTVLRLDKLLRDAGFTTVLTRNNDTFIELRDRSDIANGLNVDAFVSVHYNAHSDKAVSGVQVLYYPNEPTRDNKTFARIVQNEMLKELKAVDRYIIERPNLSVLRHTEMPAILTEMAFLSNQTEEALANTEEYRQKAAQALFNGITKYFDEVLMK